jgi:hypothetical protein
MTKKDSFMWRKGIVLSATFLLIALVSVSCKKKESELGLDVIDQGDLLESGVDTFSLLTYSIKVDSTITKNNLATMLGSYNDPTFGMVTGEIFTEVQLQAVAPAFGDLSTVAIDSFVLGLVYSGHYGKSGNQTIEVFEIDEPTGIHEDSTYYSFSSVSIGSTNLVAAGSEVLNMNEDNTTIIAGIEVPSQLRIHLDTNKARSIMEDSQSLPTSFATATAFGEYFKGLYIRTANGPQSSGQGGVFYFNMKASSTKMTIYYRQNGVSKTYDFYINSETDHFNKVTIPVSPTIQNVIDNPSAGQTQYYTQAFRTRAAIEMPTISNIPSNAVIHKAVLDLPIAHQTGADYDPAGFVRVRIENPDVSGEFLDIGPNGTLSVASYNSSNKSYTMDLRYHIQRVVNGEIDNTPLFISPVFFNSSADRIIFNGPETTYKAKPTLRILFTEF